jgi:hypothetical protein
VPARVWGFKSPLAHGFRMEPAERRPVRNRDDDDADDELQPLVAATYVALADLLDALPAEQWDATSLCEGWRVREVVAHLTMPARYSEDAFMAELREDAFDFTRLSNRVASRGAELPTVALVENLRDDALHRWTPTSAPTSKDVACARPTSTGRTGRVRTFPVRLPISRCTSVAEPSRPCASRERPWVHKKWHLIRR